MAPELRIGGGMASRPMHFFWVCDTSGSMSQKGKIQTLNQSIRDSIPAMQQASRENPGASVLVRTLRFSHGAGWVQPRPVPISDFRWADLEADPMATGPPPVDIVFLLDTSGSMGGEIDAIKRQCLSFAESVARTSATVRLGLVGFDIGSMREHGNASCQVKRLSAYNIGVWPLSPPQVFERNIQELQLAMFGGMGCYLANSDSVDIFPEVVRVFNGPPEHARVLVIISDEMGDTSGLHAIVETLRMARIRAHVMGVPDPGGAHEEIAKRCEGRFWGITSAKEGPGFAPILEQVSQTIAKEVSLTLQDGTTSSGTDMGAALRLVAKELHIPPMVSRALPPVIVLVSDGEPTDNFEGALHELLSEPWGQRAVRIAIAIGGEANTEVLWRFIGKGEVPVLNASNAAELAQHIRWVSTSVIQSVSDAGSASAIAMRMEPPPVGESDPTSKSW